MSTESRKSAQPRRRFQSGTAAASAPQHGLNRIPQWLTQDKGLPDWLAGSLVVVAGGLLLMLLVWLLIVIFPAR